MAQWQVGDSFPVEGVGPPRLSLGDGKERPPRGRLHVRWTLPLLVSYLAFGVFWIFAAPITLAHIGERGWHSRREGLLALLLSPLSLCFASQFFLGAASYAVHNPRIQVRRWDATMAHQAIAVGPSLEVTPRYPDASVWLYEAPNNLAVRLLSRCFGPVYNRHLGAVPSPAEAFEDVALGASFPLSLRGDLAGLEEDFERPPPGSTRDLALFALRTVGLYSSELGSRARRAWLSRPSRIGGCGIRTRDARWDCRVAERGDTIILGNRRLVLLISRQTKRIYACYRQD